VIDAENLDDVLLDAVGHDVGSVGDDQFFCPGDTAGPAEARLFL